LSKLGHWQHISYDMIVGLPPDGDKDAILVIVDSFSKYGVMIPCSAKITAKGVAELFLDHIWKRHGFPEKTISDRGPVFNNKYLKALYKRLGIKAHFSSVYHPQTDRQTEQMNPGIEQYLRAYAGMYQKDWVKWLPMAEFSYNNTIHSAMGTSPFRCLYGRDPVMTPSKVVTEVLEANSTADTLQEIWDETKAALNLAKERMAGREPEGVTITFEVGERVWLDSQNLRLKTNSPKLTDCHLGPFEISEKLSERAYHLKLPENLKIHNVFYVDMSAGNLGENLQLAARTRRSRGIPQLCGKCPHVRAISGLREFPALKTLRSGRAMACLMRLMESSLGIFFVYF
jgi:hypothetical protein